MAELPRGRLVALTLGASLLLAGVPAAPQDVNEVPYRVELRGVEDEELRELLLEVSQAQQQIDRPPASRTVLRRRAREDVPRLLQALNSRGYYDAEVESAVRVDPEAEAARVVFTVDPGQLYRLANVVIEVEPEAPRFARPEPADLGLEGDQPAAARGILDAEQALLQTAQEQGFALAELGERSAVIDRETKTMDVTFRLRPGPLARLGPVEFEGLETVDEAFLRNRVPWQPGTVYDPELFAEFRQSLIATNLFASARVRVAERVDADGRLPVTVELTERKHRSIALGARFRSDEGPGVSASWEHRNFLGRGEQLEVELDLSPVNQTLSVEGRKPDFWVPNQSLLAGASLRREDTDAFESTSIGASVGIERPLTPDIDYGIGVAFRLLEIDDNEGSDSFALLSLPNRLTWDTSDDFLDPTEGGRLRVEAAPFVDLLGNAPFGKAFISYTRYQTLLAEPQLVLAGRLGLGTLFGANRDDVPADERFYAGGGGSVRGFEFQSASPLDEDDDPVGGRSVLELAVELRARITETIGGVAFVDAGRAFEAEYPDFEDDLLVGAGVGVRYFTPIGPLRVDLAVPLNRRDFDDDFQVYISLGQAF